MQPVDHLGAVGAVAQHLAESLVERAPGRVVVHLVAQLVDPHRRADDAGHRAHRVAVVARLEGDPVAAARAWPRPPRPCRRAPRRASAPMSAPFSGPEARSQLDRRAGVQEGAPLEAERLVGAGARRRGRLRPPSSGAAPRRWPRRAGGRRARVRGRRRCRPSAAATAASVTDDGLGAKRVGEERDPGGRDRDVGGQQSAQRPDRSIVSVCRAPSVGGASREVERVPGGLGVGEEDRGAGPLQRGRRSGPGPAGRPRRR